MPSHPDTQTSHFHAAKTQNFYAFRQTNTPIESVYFQTVTKSLQNPFCILHMACHTMVSTPQTRPGLSYAPTILWDTVDTTCEVMKRRRRVRNQNAYIVPDFSWLPYYRNITATATDKFTNNRTHENTHDDDDEDYMFWDPPEDEESIADECSSFVPTAKEFEMEQDSNAQKYVGSLTSSLSSASLMVVSKFLKRHYIVTFGLRMCLFVMSSNLATAVEFNI